ncbi:hypothetical protein AB0J72_12480 [Dactylosporangium sp. NPDC049742]|uniref:hypothetical protein n=1 Tax=Dactylosporangium sp. NPDC049742 TaxID=3154737 RepID=UPI003437BA71
MPSSWPGGFSANVTVNFGFNGSWNGSNPIPTAFPLNLLAQRHAVQRSRRRLTERVRRLRTIQPDGDYGLLPYRPGLLTLRP